MVTFDGEESTPEIDSVDEYFFENSAESIVSFSAVPVLFDDACIPEASSEKIFLCGVTNGGIQPVYKLVVGWKLVSGYNQAKIMVRIKSGKWITLLRPKEAYLSKERSLMITVELLHFLMKEPNSSEESLLDYLHCIFSKLVVAPSMEDIKDHRFIKLFMQRNENLATSPVLLSLLSGKSRNLSKDQSKDSIVADEDESVEVNMINGEDDSQSASLNDSDSFCAICDDGGDLVCCEGGCFRSFHATKAAGAFSNCKSLGLKEEDVKALASSRFICKNCMYEQHQCFVCGKLGSSNKLKGAEVYVCDSRVCGHFYHPKCLASCIYWDSKAEALDYEKKIESGKSFVCPLHHCAACKIVENKEVKEWQLAICRRCPKAYHKKCLPRKIILEDKSTTKRVWDDTKFDRIVMYCLKHTIDRDTGTPARDHIVFPDDLEKKRVPYVQKNIETNKKKKSENPKDPKRSCKRSVDSSDKKMAAVMQTNKIKPLETSEKLCNPGTENSRFEEESDALSEKQKGKTSSSQPHRRDAKTGKRVQIPLRKFNKNSSSVMYSQNGRRIGMTNMNKEVVHKSSTSLDCMDRNSMKSSATGQQIGNTNEQDKVMQTAIHAIIDTGSADAKAGSSQENAKMTNSKDFNFEERNQKTVSETSQPQRSDFGNGSSSQLPSLFANLEQFVKPWSSAKASTEMHGLGSGMHPCERGFALGPDEQARSIHTSFGWLD